jgi:hydroxyethylthiazole kinase
MESMNTRAAAILTRVREQKPLIHHITNMVVMNDTANATIQLGGLPVMAHAVREMAEMSSAAGALILNIGTLTPDQIDAMLLAGKQANQQGTPIILDPVGAGATTLRTEAAHTLLRNLSIQVIRGNAGEIGAVSGMGGTMRGVESIGSDASPEEMARHTAQTHGAIVAITGKRDIISDGTRTLGVDNGHRWLTTLTGTGCMATTAIAAFAAVARDDYLAATASGLAAYGLAAELAAPQARGPGTFRAAFLDALYHLTPEQVAEGARIADIVDTADKVN